jgi:carbon-monoxide dehydrogenase large subunit
MYVGKSVERVDALEKVTGAAVFTADIKLPNMLHAKILRSPYPHARIVNVDTEKARGLTGVKVILTGKDVPFTYGATLKDQPFLATDKVRYAYEPVAAVAAIDEEIAEEAIELIKVDYEELPLIVDPEEAMKEGTPLIHEELHTYPHRAIANPIPGTNICSFTKLVQGDVDKGFKESDYLFENRFTSQMVHHCAIEPHCAIAVMDINGKLTVWTPNDSPYRVRNDLATALGIPMTKIRVIIPYLGGGFGGKGGLTAEPLCVALAMKAEGRPVRLVFTREEVFTSTMVRHPCIIEMKAGVKKDGKLVARKVRLVWDTGAYAEKGPSISRAASLASTGPYNIPNIQIEGYCVYTNKVVAGAFRGYGVPQVTWAFESQMDIIAEKLGMDPLELRLKNAVEEGDRSPKGDVLHSVGLKECLRKACDAISWGKRDRVKYSGKGVASMHKWQGVFQSTAIVRINEDGTVSLLTSTVEIGQGARTILSQILAEELSIAPEHITMPLPDTDTTPYDGSTTGSRSTFNMGNAVRFAAKDAKEQLLALAEKILEVNRENLELEDGNIFVRGNKEKKVSFSRIMEIFGEQRGMILGRGSYSYGRPDIYDKAKVKSTEQTDEQRQQIMHPMPFMYGAQAAEVEVDVETGSVHIIEIAAAHDVGFAINPMTCEQQIEGALGMGVGTTFFECYQYKDGIPLNPDFLSYKIPTSLDMPSMIPILVECNHKDGPFGAKGLGEPGLAATAAALSNAIYDAVGVRIYDLPITPDKILKELQRKKCD